MPKRKQKNTKKISIWGIVLIGIVVLIIGVIAKMQYDLDHNSNVSAKPEAVVVEPYITQVNANVLHTYNRAKNMNVQSPSYEYYLELPMNNIDTYRATFADFMRAHGYTSMAQKYTYNNDCNYLNNSQEACTKLGYQTQLTGSTQNKGEPYWVIYGEKGNSVYHAELSTKTFRATSNDLYREKHGEDVRSGASVLKLTFSRKDAN